MHLRGNSIASSGNNENEDGQTLITFIEPTCSGCGQTSLREFSIFIIPQVMAVNSFHAYAIVVELFGKLIN